MSSRAEQLNRNPRNNASPAGRRADRERAEAAALAEADFAARLCREKTDRLRRLRLARDED